MSKALILGNGRSLLTEGWVNNLNFASVYGVNRSYEAVCDANIWVTADEIALKEGMKHFDKHGWPDRIVTTMKTLNALESAGPVYIRCPVDIWQGASFSGTLAMRSAAIEEFNEIYLVGFDGGKGDRFYDVGIGDVREDYGQAYTSLRDMVVEAFPETKWLLWDGEQYEPI